MDKLPNRIFELRRARGLSQEELASRIGTSKQQVGRYEAGKQEITLTWLRRFAVALNCNVADVLCDADNPNRLDMTEQGLVDRYRHATPERQEDLARIAETLLPYHAPDADAA